MSSVCWAGWRCHDSGEGQRRGVMISDASWERPGSSESADLSESAGSSKGAREFAFQLDATPILSRSTVDRSESSRQYPDHIRQLWQHGRIMLVDSYGRARIDTDERLAFAAAREFGESPSPEAVLLGSQGSGGYWALRTDREQAQEGWQDLRSAGAMLSDTDAGLFTTAVGLLGWHDRSRYCALCGARTTRVRSGWARRCSGCDREEYPRTDPAVICLVHDGAEHVLLARQHGWPVDRYSVLAGFVEVGESLEACVQREVFEEVDARVSHVRYLGSQPWPFPRSLMVGFAAVADSSLPIRPAEGEIEDARWVHRETIRAALAAGTDRVPGLRLPPEISIAHRMLRGWVAARA